MSEDDRRKIAMFCNVEAKNVIAFRDVKNTIYECPLDLSQDKIDRIVTKRDVYKRQVEASPLKKGSIPSYEEALPALRKAAQSLRKAQAVGL